MNATHEGHEISYSATEERGYAGTVDYGILRMTEQYSDTTHYVWYCHTCEKEIDPRDLIMEIEF